MTTDKQTAIYLALASALVLGSTQVQAQAQTDPDGNTAYGANTLADMFPPPNGGKNNSAFGLSALWNNQNGDNNTAIGAFTLQNVEGGSDNTAIGYYSLSQNDGGYYNTATGSHALYYNVYGSYNTASGVNALWGNGDADENTAMGYNALYGPNYGKNVAVGAWAMSENHGAENTAVGYYAMYNHNGNSNYNAVLGAWAMYYNTTGNSNNAQGYSALYSNMTGIGNAAFGRNALYSNTTGSFNMGIGGNAGFSNSTGSSNVFIGRFAGYNELGSNKLYIANNATSPLLYSVFSTTGTANKLGIGTATIAAGDTITVANGAHLTTGGAWVNASSRELKENIQTLSTEDANKALAGLSPVRYVYKNSGDEEYVGFIAEDVPALVAMNDHKSLSPMDIVAVLTTVTKEQKAEITEQQAENTLQKSEIAALHDALAKQDERMLQMEMALAELQRNRTSENQVGSRD